MISGTITDASGRTCRARPPRLLEFLSHAQPISFGLNCALGAKELRQYVEELSNVCDTFVSAHPNAGLPNPCRPPATTRRPEQLAGQIGNGARPGEHRRRLLRHLADHIRPSPRRRRLAPRAVPTIPPLPAPVRPSPSTSAPTRCCQRRRAHQRHRLRAFARMILEGRFDDALAVARQQVENGAQVIDINMDEAMLDSGGDGEVPQAHRLRADISRVPIMLDSSKWACHRGRPEVHPGQGAWSIRSR